MLNANHRSNIICFPTQRRIDHIEAANAHLAGEAMFNNRDGLGQFLWGSHKSNVRPPMSPLEELVESLQKWCDELSTWRSSV